VARFSRLAIVVALPGHRETHGRRHLFRGSWRSKFGSDDVFFASKSIRVGEDFVTRILDRLRQCYVFLAVIGSRWLTATDRQGARRLDNPDDCVRRAHGDPDQHRLHPRGAGPATSRRNSKSDLFPTSTI
jgi:hypothetical protein